MVTKYFVEVIASNKQQLINLQKFELDLFQSTAKSIDDKEFKIDGLISLDDLELQEIYGKCKVLQSTYNIFFSCFLVSKDIIAAAVYCVKNPFLNFKLSILIKIFKIFLIICHEPLCNLNLGLFNEL